MNKPKGVTINYSHVINEDGNQEIGFRYNDTDGINIDKHYTGTQEDKLIAQLCKDVQLETEKQAAALKETNQIKKLEAEKKQQKQDYAALLAAFKKEAERLAKENEVLKDELAALNKKLEEKPAEKPALQENKTKATASWEDWAVDFLNELFK